VVDAVGETPLSKTWLDEQLNNTEQLQSHFSPTELEVEGVRVLRLDDVEENEFYQTLGLQEKDVILRVNKEWVHEAQNNLFEQLDSQQEVSIVLMRKGLPVHLKYSIN
jgi:type II secretory pathway component PulC